MEHLPEYDVSIFYIFHHHHHHHYHHHHNNVEIHAPNVSLGVNKPRDLFIWGNISTSTTSLQSAISLLYVSFLSTYTPCRFLCFILLDSFFFISYFQVCVLAEVVPLSCMRSSGMQSQDSGSRLTLARELKMTKREELKQNSRQILDGGSKSEDPSRVNNSATSGTAFDKLMARRNNRRVNRKDFRIDTEKLIMSIPFNGKKLSLKRRVLNSTLNTGKTGKILRNSSFITMFENRNDHPSEQMRSKFPVKVPKNKLLDVANSSVSSVKKLQRRSPGSFLPWNSHDGRNGRNPCVRKIVKTYYGKLDRVFTEYKCHRATFYCSPTFGGLGRCIAVKTFYVNINKVLTTACKCID